MKRQKTHRFLLILAFVSFIIAALQGLIYYKSYDLFFKILLVLQNSINAFGFKATISIKDVVAFINNDPSTLNLAVGYAYCVAVFTAPYCTVSFLYKFLERILRFMVSFRRSKKHDHILIFGWNDDVKALIRNNRSADRKGICIHIITDKVLDHSEVYQLNKEGVRVHTSDVLKLSENEICDVMERMYVDRASNILLFEESSIRNFSLLQLFRLNDADSNKRIKLRTGAKISCRCEEEGINRLISNYYNHACGIDSYYDLEIISLPEMQIQKMYSEIPLHKYYSRMNVPLKDQHLHLLVAGLGQLGQQAVLKAMNLGVVHEQNDIIIDVFDTNIINKMKQFTKQFSDETFDFSDNKMTLRNTVADGRLVVNFFGADAKQRDFYSAVTKRNSELHYTYSVITFDNVDLAVDCAMRLNEIFANDEYDVPVLVRMDTDRRLAGYISGDSEALEDVDIIDDRSCVINLDMIINRTIDQRAKNYNHFYNNISILSENDTGNTDSHDAPPEQEWNSIRLFRRSSSKAAAYHDQVKDMIIPTLAAECGVDVEKKLDLLIGENGLLMQFDGKAWHMNCSEKELLERLRSDSFAYGIASLEHRRWCCYMASIGWKCGKRSDKLRCNPCMVPQEELMEKMPEMCKYDIMSLMTRFLVLRENSH